ncbi:hypothetical protein [Streptomyces mutomycini]|uniref:Uncharacterized protein n=1 Tax=Streptomyces mutomycini TaxID=284036 RepID=A0ABW0BCF7_9ACTN|nr:hypothetical protein [Streptomyces mutomycini]
MSPAVWPPALDWKSAAHWDYDAEETGAPRPCVLCGKPSLLLSEKGEPCHKVCAEGWFEQHPEAWAVYEAQRDRKKTTAQEVLVEPVIGSDDSGLFETAA